MFKPLAIAVAAVAAIVSPAAAIETATYEVIKTDGKFELRNYAPRIEAQVTVEAPDARKAAGAAFTKLAGYIFGGNQNATKIEMTAPVTAAPAPVSTNTTLTGDGRYTVAFTMPSKWTLDTLPKPEGDEVVLKQVAGGLQASWSTTGEMDVGAMSESEAALREWVAALEGYEVSGAATWAGYDGPDVAEAERRYDILLPVVRQ